jgi:hypothetical protein
MGSIECNIKSIIDFLNLADQLQLVNDQNLANGNILGHILKPKSQHSWLVLHN